MNVFQTTVVFICFVVAEGNFPAVIFEWDYFLATPEMQKYSEAEMEVGFVSKHGGIFAACPWSGYDQSEVQIEANNPAMKRLVPGKIIQAGQRIFLDQLPTCKSSPRATFQREYEKEDYIRYQIGYEVYRKKEENDEAGSSFDWIRDACSLGEVFRLNFSKITGRTTSVIYELSDQLFRPTASNKKRIVAYEKNEKFLPIDIDDLYQHFVDQILPQMLKEKSKNKLAHELGIQKVQLATPDDFPLDTWKMATYWNINTVPIWRVLLLRWNAIEIYIRKLHKRDIHIQVETGASGTLEFADRDHENNTLHKLHIPKYVWKLIPNSYSVGKAVLIVMHNDPFTEHQEPLCEDICAINGWLLSNNDYRTGLIYCCEMTEKIAQILEHSDDVRYFGNYSFTKNVNGTENLTNISRILSDLQDRLYDW